MEPQTLSELLAWEPVYPEAILGDGLLYAQCKLIMYGKPKAFKSMVVTHLGLSLSTGADWCAFPVPKKGVSVLYLQLEIPHPLLKDRLVGMSQNQRPQLSPMWFWTEHYLKLDQPAGLAVLERVVTELRPQVLIIDPVYKVLSGKITDPTQIGIFLDYLDMLIGKHGLSIILVAHTRKSRLDDSDDGQEGEDLMGASTFVAWADSVIKVTRQRPIGKEEYLRLQFDFVRHATDLIDDKEVVFNRDDMTFWHIPEPRLKIVKESTSGKQV